MLRLTRSTSLQLANLAILTGYSTAPLWPPSLSRSSNSCADFGESLAASSKVVPPGPRLTQTRQRRGEVASRPPPVPIKIVLRGRWRA